ncbi:GcrA family cell cycle regulator [Labrys monachus]|uniref:GcrA cell cycle regulator n=1 Tax=Labrys monachus TaxID=217067 RepID=A0ABU0FD96_9HYPH|nr:GcrA family cell cycle regulator [Labrys monachus]MDQ0392573.1 GcrA cell cycle regulator [Labrys monachus]
MHWTDERVELLKKLWSEGLSASAIATELGGVTRNAVIGKVHRLGLSGRAKTPAPAPQRRAKPTRTPSHPLRPQAPTPVIRGNTALAPQLTPLAAVEEQAEPKLRPVEDVVVPMSERVTIMELREHMCRWPLGDPGREDFRFCGSRVGVQGPYCSHHAAIAYQPIMDRRRDRDKERRLARA